MILHSLFSETKCVSSARKSQECKKEGEGWFKERLSGVSLSLSLSCTDFSSQEQTHERHTGMKTTHSFGRRKMHPQIRSVERFLSTTDRSTFKKLFLSCVLKTGIIQRDIRTSYFLFPSKVQSLLRIQFVLRFPAHLLDLCVSSSCLYKNCTAVKQFVSLELSSKELLSRRDLHVLLLSCHSVCDFFTLRLWCNLSLFRNVFLAVTLWSVSLFLLLNHDVIKSLKQWVWVESAFQSRSEERQWLFLRPQSSHVLQL